MSKYGIFASKITVFGLKRAQKWTYKLIRYGAFIETLAPR